MFLLLVDLIVSSSGISLILAEPWYKKKRHGSGLHSGRSGLGSLGLTMMGREFYKYFLNLSKRFITAC